MILQISARAESIVIEGANADNDLVPLVTADNIYTGNTNTNFLSIDFEKNPHNAEADFGLTCSLEPIEIVYNEVLYNLQVSSQTLIPMYVYCMYKMIEFQHALSEIINFFQTRSMAMRDITQIISGKLQKAASLSKSLINYVIVRHKVINVNMDLKGPYIIIPECGSLQK